MIVSSVDGTRILTPYEIASGSTHNELLVPINEAPLSLRDFIQLIMLMSAK